MEETKYCTNCKQSKPLIKFDRNSDGSVRKHICKLCYGRKARAQLKLDMLEAFGWRCQCCGEDNPQFLSLDHLRNDGGEHRALYASSNNNLVIRDARNEGWPKDKYQLLCMNCNTAKGYYGECPHKKGLTASDIIADLRSKIFLTGKTLQSKENRGLAFGPAASAISEKHRKFDSESSQKANEAKRVKNKPTIENLQQLVKGLRPEELQALLLKYPGSGKA